MSKESNVGGRPNDMNDISQARQLLTQLIKQSIPELPVQTNAIKDLNENLNESKNQNDQMKELSNPSLNTTSNTIDENVVLDLIPPNGELSIRCSSVLKYNTTTYKKRLTIQNVSKTRTHKWMLQIHPAQYFLADIGFGILQPSSTIESKLKKKKSRKHGRCVV